MQPKNSPLKLFEIKLSLKAHLTQLYISFVMENYNYNDIFSLKKVFFLISIKMCYVYNVTIYIEIFLSSICSHHMDELYFVILLTVLLTFSHIYSHILWGKT